MNTLSSPRCILITGASGGIGAALAYAYAAPGVTLILNGRRVAQLQAVADACQARGARIRLEPLDVRDLDALRLMVQRVSETEQPDLVLVSAGLNTAAQEEAECPIASQALLEVNVLAAVATVEAALPSMRQRGHGQLALFSSLAGWRGLPLTPSYCASKAAIRVYGEAMRDLLAPSGVKVNVILPGYVESKMCAEMPGPKPFLWPADKAARYIQRGLAANRARISFPFPLNLGTWLLGVMPQRLSSWTLRRLKYSV